MKGLLFALAMTASLWFAAPASAEIVEVTTTLDITKTADAAAVKQALRTAVDKILENTVAFKPTLVAVTDAEVVGERLYVRILLADEQGEQMLKDVGRDPMHEPDDDDAAEQVRI